MCPKPEASEISVVIVTHNRPDDCVEAIRSVIRQNAKPLEIIVLDDFSSTHLTLDSDLSGVRLVRTKRELGLGAARTLGSILASGSAVAFMDDDGLADEDWVSNIVQALEKSNDIVGGLCEPLYLSPTPWWWDDRILGFLVGVRNDCLPNSPAARIFGCNFAVKKEVLRNLGYFNRGLGRRRGKQFGGDDVLFLLEAAQRGYRISFEQGIQVCHKVKPERMTVRYLIRRAYYGGASWRIIFAFDLGKILAYIRLVKLGGHVKGKWSSKSVLLILRLVQVLGYLTTS